MKVVIQRVNSASVSIFNKIHSSIENGFLILAGIETEDEEEDLFWLVKKIINLRIFNDNEGKMNLNVKDVQGSILIISQFTLHASTKKGNRPSFIKAARPEKAISFYNLFIQKLKEEGLKVESGVFGAEMKISLVNDGPVTIIIDSKNRS